MGPALLSVVFLLAGVGESQAATARVVEEAIRYGTVTTPIYSAALGERNDLSVYRLASVIHFADRGALVEPGAGCESLTADIVRCGDLSFPRVYAGDGADSVAMDVDDGTVYAGTGDDEVLGGGALLGEEGDDILRTGASQPILFGGPGDDRLLATSTIPEMRGGPGDDVLRGGPDGGDLQGGRGDDRIYGERGRDHLDGGPGNDRLVDRSGPGASQFGSLAMRGGSGADSIDSVDGLRERIHCGPGRDTIRADRVDRLRGCERIRRARPPRR